MRQLLPAFHCRRKTQASTDIYNSLCFNLSDIWILQTESLLSLLWFCLWNYFRDLKNLFSKLVTELSVSFPCFWLEKKIILPPYTRIMSRQLELNSPAVVQLPYIFQYKYSSFYLQAFRPRPNMRRSFCGIHETSNDDRDMSSMHRPWFPMNRGWILLLNAVSLYPSVLRRHIVPLLLLSSKEQGAKVRQVL